MRAADRLPEGPPRSPAIARCTQQRPRSVTGGPVRGRARRVAACLTLVLAGSFVPFVSRVDAAAVGEVGCFISATYQVFLDTEPSGSEVVQWADAIGEGVPRSALPEQLANSDRWLGLVVDGLYRDALGREPDAAGRRYWTSRLRAGAFVNSLGSAIYGSAEFFENAGSTPDGFVRALYTRILHREADAPGVDFWSDQIEAGQRGAVASAFFSSPESRSDRVLALYHSVLGRAPDPDGLGYWMTRLLSENDVRLAVQLASSNEFYNRSIVPGQGCALPPDWQPA